MEKEITNEEVEWLVRNRSIGEYFDRFMIHLALGEGQKLVYEIGRGVKILVTPSIRKKWLIGIRLLKNMHHERK